MYVNYNQEISNVEVYNLVGQKVANITPNANEGQINMSFPVFRIIKSKTYKVDLYFGDQEDNSDIIIDAFYFNVLQSLSQTKLIQEKLNYFYDSEIKFY